jgi:hypothetical protein
MTAFTLRAPLRVTLTGALTVSGDAQASLGTPLSDLAASMTSGQWEQMSPTPSGLDLFTGQSGSGGMIVAYADKMVRDAAAAALYFIGCDHGVETRFLQYDEATNAWSAVVASVPFGIGNGGDITNHSWEHHAFDSARTKHWFRPYGSRLIRRWASGTTWDTIDYSGVLFSPSAAIGVCYYPERDEILIYQVENGTKGALIGIDPDNTASITTYVDASSSTLDPTPTSHVFLQHSQPRGLCYLGGGNSGRRCYTFNSAGTVTRLDDFPAAITNTVGPAGDTAVSNPSALPLVNPANGNLVVIQTDDNWWECDPTAGSGSQWSEKSGTADILSANVADADSAYGVCAVPIPEYGVVAFVKNYNRAQPAQMWLWKP